jgi:hypothetical protein
MPPTRDGLRRLFEAMNLEVSPIRCIDCLVYCRGKKMEHSNPDDFDMKRLVQWFMLNLRTFKHADESAADRDWREDTKARGQLARSSLPAPPWKPHPSAFMRGHTGSGGRHLSRILKSRGLRVEKHACCNDVEVVQETAPSAFQEYGIGAPTMASTYDFVTNMQAKGRGGALGGAGSSALSQSTRSAHPYASNVDGFARNAAFGGGSQSRFGGRAPSWRHPATAGAGHRRLKTVGDGKKRERILGVTEEEPGQYSEGPSPGIREVGSQGAFDSPSQGRQPKPRLALERDMHFRKEMQETITNLKRMPGFKNKVWETVTGLHQQYEQEKGEKGVRAGEVARERLLLKQQQVEQDTGKGLEKLIQETAETSALQAINLSRLLRRNWSEEKNAYVIMSNIRSERQSRRLMHLLREHQY